MATSGASLRFVGHATVRIETQGSRILTDPLLRTRLGPLERHGPVPDLDGFRDIDLVLISHAHPDHLDRSSIEAIGGPSSVVVVPRGLGSLVRGWVTGDVVELAVGERMTHRGISIEAVPARHWMTPGGPRAQPQGYLLDSGMRIWFAGDTGRFAGIRDLAGRVDVALVPIWTWGPHLGPGHLGPRSAAEVVSTIEAQIAVPIHWGTLYPRRLHRLWRRPLTEPGERFAAHVARLAPDVDIRVLRPGDQTTVEVAEPSVGRLP